MEYDRQQYVFMKAFQIAAEESGSLVFIYDLATQTIQVDPRTAKAFGVAEIQPGVPYEMVKRGVIAPDSIKEYIRVHEEVLNGAPNASGTVRLVQADGSESVQELTFRAILSEDGQPTGSAVGVYRDITDRTREELEQERYRQAIRSSERYTFRYDIQQDVLSVYAPVNGNDQGEEQEEESLLVTQDFLKSVDSGAVCPEDQVEAVKRLFDQGTEQTVHIQMRHARTGELVWFGFLARRAQKPGCPPMVYGLLWDATEEIRHRDTYSKLQRALLGMQNEYVGIFEVDLGRDWFTMLAYRGQEYLPLPSEGVYSEVLGQAVDRLVTEDYQEEFRRFTSLENLRRSLAQENRIELEYTIRSQENAWLRTIFQVTERVEGQPAKVAMYHADIDRLKAERLLQQQALKDAYHYAESANTAKTEFLSRMSHDIRTPMNAIVGMAAIAATHLHEPDRIQDCLAKINMSSRHLLALINEILDMSKIESGAIELQEEEFSLADLIDETLTIVMPSAQEHGHVLEVNVQKLRHERVFGDCLRLQQAFVNLFSNAVKYTPDGGEIRMTALERPSHSANYGEYEFIFEDNGIGMSPEFLKVLFEPFTRAEDSRLSKVTGTGLGMAITHNLIRMMDGDIRVDSTLGKGTRFTVTIHLKFVPEESSLPEMLCGLPVLLADDDKDACESTCILLREIGLDAEWCLNGQRAVELAAERNRRGEDYFAIILDWKMPGMDGLETAVHIRETVGDHIPILFLTAYDWSEIEAQARSIGVTHFLTKPLFKSRLLSSFRELVRPEEQETQIEPAMGIYENTRVLLAEDNDLNAEIGEELLSMMGIAVQRASDGREAVELFQSEPPGHFDLILMDIQMPVMDGYEAARAIRGSSHPDAAGIPIVAMTANAFAEDVKQSIMAGMNEHLTKPVDLDALRRVLDACLRDR
ncbi:response regulator [Intestinimonas sp.]|uniref:response regulator n=1 Tax=Intestinimonas sp. TaxID=1965293 RepID=UPI002610E9F2|nr:response regulator [Intestinimonas sp.]